MKKKKSICAVCFKGFKNEHGLRIHNHKMHPYIPAPPPPAPKREVFVADSGLPETFNLKGAKLDIGDVFYHVKKLVVKRMVKVEGSETLEVEADVTKRWWSSTHPL